MRYRTGDLVVPNFDVLERHYGRFYANLIRKKSNNLYKIPWQVIRAQPNSLSSGVYQLRTSATPDGQFPPITLFYEDDELKPYDVPQEKLE